MHRDDDEAWRSIVDNYGDRVELDDPAPPAAELPETVDDGDHDEGQDDIPAPAPAAATGWDDDPVAVDPSTERFVPPPPPPLPRTTADRYLAWLGVFGSPVVLLLSVVFDYTLPELIAYLLVIGFIGGFLYLVFQMPREPRDPGDDGARL